jgi:hypothetical protein
MYSTGPSPFFVIVAIVLAVLNIWATIIVIRAVPATSTALSRRDARGHPANRSSPRTTTSQVLDAATVERRNCA